MGQEKLPGPHFLVRMRGFAPQVALTRKCGPGNFSWPIFVGPGPFLASGQLSPGIQSLTILAPDLRAVPLLYQFWLLGLALDYICSLSQVNL